MYTLINYLVCIISTLLTFQNLSLLVMTRRHVPFPEPGKYVHKFTVSALPSDMDSRRGLVYFVNSDLSTAAKSTLFFFMKPPLSSPRSFSSWLVPKVK